MQTQTRIVPYAEIEACPAHRLDAEHYIPMHRTYEHRFKQFSRESVLARSKEGLLELWLDEKISGDDFVMAMECVTHHDQYINAKIKSLR